MRKRKKSSQKKIRASVATYAPEPSHWLNPWCWLKNIVAVFLLIPAACLLTWTFYQTFSTVFVNEAARGPFWLMSEFWCFASGMVVGGVFFFYSFRLSQTIKFYVFGHEITHALGVYYSLGRVERLQVGEDGGHVISSKINTFIALAPYCLPIYSVILVGIYGWIGFFYPAVFENVYANYALFWLIGITWAYHIAFTCWMLTKDQADIAYGGWLFSWVTIYIVNLLCLSAVLILASSHATFRGFAVEFVRSSENLPALINLYFHKILYAIR